MKIIVFSDIQFNPWPEFSKTLSNGLNSRFQDQLNVLEEVFEHAISLSKHDEVILVHTGDLFESMTEKIDKSTFLTVFELFRSFSSKGILTFLLVGNHDWLDRTETIHILKPFQEIDHTVVIDEPFHYKYTEDVGLVFVPFTRQGFKEKLDSLVTGFKMDRMYAFTHQGVNGAMVGPRDIPLKDEYNPSDFRLDVFSLVFNGHYHKPQSFANGLYVVGSPLQKDFGERNDAKGFWILDTKETPTTPVFVKTHGPRFYKIEITKEGDITLPDSFCPTDFLWVVYSGVGEDRIKEVFDPSEINLSNVRFECVKKNEARTRTDISISMTVKEQISTYLNWLWKHGEYLEYREMDLDKEKLLKLALDKYYASQESI